VQKEQYHAVIMDYMMSGMDGIETFRRPRSLSEKSGRTALCRWEEMKQALELFVGESG
jgi:CheY-like chemotaxis protein